jgi:hypothetical protein
MREEVVLAETDPLGGLIHSVVGYVTSTQGPDNDAEKSQAYSSPAGLSL